MDYPEAELDIWVFDYCYAGNLAVKLIVLL
jgi:hypothetical protein